MGNASSIHYTPQDSVRASFCTNFIRDTTCGNQLQSGYNPFNACYSKHRTNPTEKSLPASARSRTRKPIKIDTGNLNKAILLQIVNRATNTRQPDFEDCNVPLSTEGSHKPTKAHRANHLLNRLDFDKLDADKTTTNSLDTSCIKSSPKATIFHPQAAIYFEYDKSQENQLLRFNPGQHDVTPDISWEEPLRTGENSHIRPYYIESNAPKSSTRTTNNKENNLPLISDPEPSQRSQRSHRSNRSNRSNLPNTGEIKLPIIEKTPEKPYQYQDIHKTEDRTTRRLNLKSKSATRQMNQEIIAAPAAEAEVPSVGVFQFKGDPLLRNYGMISSEYSEPKKLERLLNSDSKASMPPSGRLSYTRDEKVEEIHQNGRLSVNANAKPIPKHKLLLQNNKMKRERSCELLSSGRAQSLGTRETTGQETTSVGRASLRTEFPLPRFTSPSKPEDSVLAQQEQMQQIQLDSKWQNFYTSVDEFKKEMDEVKKNSAWAEEQQRDTSQQRSQNISQGASPMNGGDPRVTHLTHFTYATLSLSSSIPHYNNETNQKSAQDSVQNIIADKLKESVEQTPRLSPLREERLSVIREDKAEGGYIIPHHHHHHHGESFNTQHFGTGTVDLQVLQLKNSMETFDPPSSCYESNITYQLDKERDTCVVDLLAKDNNSEYNRENYQSVITDINQKIDGILKKCHIITEKSNKSQNPTLLSQSPNPTFIDDGVGEMILDDPALKTEPNSPPRMSPERVPIMDSLRDREPNEIENIIGQCYTEILQKTPENQGLVTMKDDLFVKQVIQPHPVEVEVNKSYESNLRNENENENECIDSEPVFMAKEEETELVENFMTRDYREEIDVVEKVDHRNQQDDEQYFKYLKALKHMKEEEEEEQKIEDYNQTKTEENFRRTHKTVEEEVEIKEDTKRNSVTVSEPRLTAKIEVEENFSPEKTFSLQSENRNLSMQNLSIHDMNRNEKEDEKEYEEEERSVQQEIYSPNKFESSFREELKSQTENYNTPASFVTNEHTIETPVKQMQQTGLNCSPQRRESPEKPKSHNSPSPSQVQNQGWDSNRYPTLEIQRAAEELEALSKALHDLPQHADNFVSTAGLNAVKQTIMEKIESIHGDILQRIGQLNKKVETKSPLGQRRNSVLDQTQDTRKFEYSTEIDARRAHSSMKEGTRLHYSFSSQAKTESQPQSYCPSPFQSQPREPKELKEQREQPRAFEPGLTFGQDNLELRAERAALERIKKAQQKEKLAKFEPKQVSVSIMNLVDATADVSVCTSTNNKSTISNKLDNSNKLDKADKHQQSIKQVVVEQNTNSKQSSPLSYRSSLLKSATRDGAIKINRIGKSNERDNDLEAVLSSTLRRDSSSEKETKKTNKSQQNSHRGLLSSQQIRQQQISNEKEIREAFNNRQPSSPLYMSQILGTESNSQKSRRGSYSEAKNTNNIPVNNPSEEMWVQEEIEKKKKLAVELMNLSSLRKTRELEMPEDCVRKMEEWARSETSSWSQIPTVREKKNSSQGVLKVQDYLVGEGKAGTRELNEYPMSALLAKQNQSDDTIFEECDTKRISTRDQGVQTVNRNVESFYLKQRRESKENGRGLSSLQNSMIDHSMSTSTIPIASKRNQSQICIDYNNRSMGMRTPERRRTGSKNICLSDLEMLDTKRISGGYEERNSSRLMKKKTTSKPVEKQGSQKKVFKSGEKEKFYTGSNERNMKGLPRVSKSVRDNAIAISELMQAYVLEQKERIYQQD